MRNEIFARRGYCFKTKEINSIRKINSFSRPNSDIYIYLIKFSDLKEKKIIVKINKGKKDTIIETKQNFKFYPNVVI